MKPILVLYATREGHALRIAMHLASIVRTHGLAAELVDAAHVPGWFALDDYATAILVASVHRERHEREMVDFVKLQRAELEKIHAAFLSVSLSEAGAENPRTSAESRGRAAADAQRMIEGFITETGWMPSIVHPVAGALQYSKYNFLVRFLMKQVAKKTGGDTDTSRDYEYTNWTALDRFVDELVTPVAAC